MAESSKPISGAVSRTGATVSKRPAEVALQEVSVLKADQTDATTDPVVPEADKPSPRVIPKPKGTGKVSRGRPKAVPQAPTQSTPVQPEGGQMAASPKVLPVAEPAKMRKRHWGMVLSFVLMVLVPLALMIIYLWSWAEDQYSSTIGFTVRSEEGGAASQMLGGLAQIAGATTAADSDILYEYIQSQAIVQAVDQEIDLRTHYSQYWPRDFAFSIWPDATLEDLVWFWGRIVRISYDRSSGLTEVRVLAFDSETAERIAREIVSNSQTLINDLNVQAREDAMGYARQDVQEALERLKSAREAMTQFRTRTQIVDPAADIQNRMGVMANLQQQLAQALIEGDLLRETVSISDPRATKAQREIEVIRNRIAIERQTFATDSTENGALGEDYPSLIAEFESLSVDREFAEQTYRVALAALDLARDKVVRRSRYLATYVEPTRATESEFPRRYVLTALAALFLVMVWSILALVYYSIRDRG